MKTFTTFLIAVMVLASGAYMVRVHQDSVLAAEAVRQVRYYYALTPSQHVQITSAFAQGSDVCVDFVSTDARNYSVAGRFVYMEAMHQVRYEVPFDSDFCPNGHDVTRLAEEANVQ